MIPHVNDYKGDIEDDEIPFAIEQAKNIKWYDWVLLNRPLRVIVALLLTTILGPILIYRFIFFPSLELPPPDGLSIGSCLVPREARIPCGVEAVTPEQCHSQCCYDHHHNLCFHRYPSRFSYMTHHTWAEDVYLNPRIQNTPYGSQRSFRNIKLSIDEVTPTHLTLTFYKHNNITGRKLEEKNYIYSVTHPELNVVVNSTQGNIFNTARGPLIASNNIWEISFKLTNETLYGLGEIPLKPDTVKVIYNHKGASSSIPLIFAKFNGSYHGLLIDTMAPTEVIVRKDKQLVVRSITDLGLKFHLFVGPKPADIMRDAMATIKAKKNLEYWMLGAHVCRESTSTDPLEELRTFLSSASAAAPSTTRMPFESHCGTLPIVFNTECNSTMVSLVDQGATLIKNGGKRFVPHVSPYIKYTALPEPEDEENSKDENEDEEIEEAAVRMETSERCIDDDKIDHQIIRDPVSYKMYKGVVDNHDVIYPSYKVVTNETMQHLWTYNTDFDAVILENNWPLDESEKNFNQINDFLPYFSETFEAAFNFTPQWNATRPTKAVGNFTRLANSTEYPGELYFIRHSEYGNEFAKAFENIKESVPKLSSSQWMNGDIIINRQNIPTSWTNLQRELIEASLGGISGHWYWSSPICGDTEHFLNTTQIRLCAKWYMAATYMPMIKIHSKTIPRDPLAFVGTDRMHMITALNRRLSLLPYFYTVLQEGPLLRPMFYQFPSSVNITDLTTQFAVGDDILIIPNLQPSQTHVHVRMPPGTWYEFWSGMEVVGEEGQAVTLTTTEAEFLSLVRGGSIIVMQKNVQLTAELTRRQSPYSLIIALECETTIDYNATEATPTEKINKVRSNPEESTGDETSTEPVITTTEAAIPTITTCNATGRLFMNENMTITLQANSTALTITAVGEDFQVLCNENVAEWASSITEVIIYGLHEKENNYDEKRIVRPTINLCQLVNNEEIVYQFVDIDF